MPIRELTNGTDVDLVLLVQTVERRPRKSGDDFLKVVFADRTGQLPTNIWDDVDQIEALLSVGAAFRVWGGFEVHEKFGGQLRLVGFEPAVEGTYDPGDLRAGPPVPVPELEARLRRLIASIADDGMAAMLQAVLGEGTATWEAYRIAPAAKRVHQAYRHGLLEHCLTVGEAVDGAAGVFPGIDRDLAVAAALVHDIGKLDAYAFGEGDTVELTDAGKLRGEIVLGYERLHRVVDGIPSMDENRKQAFLHIILSHHGQLEHGSPVTPQTREAFLVHTMDNLGGKLGIVDRLEQERPPGSAWSGYDRAFGGSVYFAEAAEAAPPLIGDGAPSLAHDHAAGHPPSVPHVQPPAPMHPPVEAPPAHAPRGAFEDSDGWRPPAPGDLTAPPVPSEPFTAPPSPEADDPFRVSREEPAPAAAIGTREEALASPGRSAATAAGSSRAATRDGDDDLATASPEQRRGGPPVPPDAQPLPF